MGSVVNCGFVGKKVPDTFFVPALLCVEHGGEGFFWCILYALTNREYLYMHTHKPRPFIDLFVSVFIPSVILMKLSGEQALGPTNALLLALAFPLGWGAFEFVQYKKFNFIAALGLFSVLLTGGIGLLQIDPQWLAIKEAAIPGIIGIAVLVSARTRYPLVRVLLYNPNIFDVELIHQHLIERGNVRRFERCLVSATYYLSGTFVFSSVMNFILAKAIVVSPTGSPAFNEELGRLTLVSYPMIAIPSMIMTIIIFYYLWRAIRDLAGLAFEDIFISKIK